MFGIGFGEMIVIAVFLLIAVGPDKLPTMVKTVAKTYRQFRRTALELRASTGIDDLLRDEELRELAELRKQKLAAIAAKPNKPIAPVKKTSVAPPTSTRGVQSDSAESGESGAQRDSPLPKLIEHEDEAPIAPVPAERAAPLDTKDHALSSKKGLSDEQRRKEEPPEGVDISEAGWTSSSKLALGTKPTGGL